jgi:hypothetical protein
MSCVHFSASGDAWCNAQDAPPLPKSRIPRRESKVHRLYRLADDPRPNIRAAVAGNPDAPASLLRRLADDESKIVRSWVARNPHTPRHVLRRLARGFDPDIAAFARQRLGPTLGQRLRRSDGLVWGRFVVIRFVMGLWARRG